MSVLPTNIIRVSPLADALKAYLSTAVPGVQGFMSKPIGVTILPSGVAARYWVLHPYFGTPHAEQDLADTNIDRDWTVQITAAAGTPDDAYALASLVDAAMYRHELTNDTLDDLGYHLGPFHPPDGYDPGPPREDLDYSPHRWWLPLQYATTITTN